MDETSRRVGINEGIFRELNERLKELAERFGIEDEQLDFVCECGDAVCTERIRLRRADYEALRADPTLFAVAPGHARQDVETVVDRSPVTT